MKRIIPLLITMTLLAAIHAVGESLTGDELKSKQKSSLVFKSRGGVKAPGLKLEREKMASWEDAKFGMFIHWGLYAIPARGEWIMHNEEIPADEYAKLADEFAPENFDAGEWARIARDAGMKYMVLTARHHDGFALWDSPSSYKDFNSVETAAGRDFVAEYTRACREAGLGVWLFYSLMDWRFPGYFNPRELAANAALMKKQCYGQIEELMRNYGEIDMLWYDGGWLAHKGTDADAAWFWDPVKLNSMVRKYQPNVVISPRSGWEGDYQIDEGGHEVKGPIVSDIPWEKCLNLNGNRWGYTERQHLMKPDEVIRMLVNIAGRGGNMLLNVGPDRNGVIPPAHVRILEQVGDWLEFYGESIYGTRPGPFQPVDNYYCSMHKGDAIYVHVVQWGDAETLSLAPLDRKIEACELLTGGTAGFEQSAGRIEITVPREYRKTPDTIVKILLHPEEL